MTTVRAPSPDSASTESPVAGEVAARSRMAIPRPTQFRLRRDRLLDTLTRATTPLVLLSAPAGSGKTTLAAEWAEVSQPHRHIVWINCHDECPDPVRDLIVALHGPDAPVPPAQPASAARQERARLVLQAVDRSPLPTTVVLDGYELRSVEAAQELDQLMRYATGRLQILLTSRVDPVLPLHRYRLTETVVELRASDLAFSDDEAHQLLHAVGVDLDPVDAHALNSRLSGWAAGLRFAARALAGQSAPQELVSTAVTYNGDINAYLVGELLDVQPPQQRRLMLTTSVPDVLYPELIEELTGGPAAPIILELSRSNVFLEELSGNPAGLSYVPFFRDLLRAQLAYESPGRLTFLHQKAAGWYSRHGLWDQAVAHLGAAEDTGGVTDLLVEHLLVGRLLCEPEDGALRAAVKAPRGRVVDWRDHLVAAALCIVDDHLDDCATHLEAARSAAELSPAGVLTAGLVDAVRASRADDASTAAALATLAEEQLLDYHRSGAGNLDDHAALLVLARATAAMRLGSLGRASALFREALASSTAAWSATYRRACLVGSGLLAAYSGLVAEADQAVTEALRLARGTRLSGRDLSTKATANAVAAYVALEEYDLGAAEERLAATSPCRDPICFVVQTIVAAGLLRSKQQAGEAVQRLDAAVARVASTDPWFADWLRIEAAAMRLASSEPVEALSDLARVDLAPAEAAVAMAAAHQVSGDRDAARRSLQGLRAGERPALRVQVTEHLVEASMDARISPQRARAALRGAIRLAQPQELRRPFFEADSAVRALITQERGPRTAGGDWLSSDVSVRPEPFIPAQRGALPSPMIEQLTPREREVLVCMSELLTTDEIAAKLFVSVNTVRTHVRNILTKLGVSRRNAAVREARRLGLLEP